MEVMEGVHQEDGEVVSDLPGCCEEREGCGESGRLFWAVCTSGEQDHRAMTPLITRGMDLPFPRTQHPLNILLTLMCQGQ